MNASSSREIGRPITPLKNIDDDMAVELGPSAVNSEVKQPEDLKTVEKGNVDAQEVDVVIDYDE